MFDTSEYCFAAIAVLWLQKACCEKKCHLPKEPGREEGLVSWKTSYETYWRRVIFSDETQVVLGKRHKRVYLEER